MHGVSFDLEDVSKFQIIRVEGSKCMPEYFCGRGYDTKQSNGD